MTLRKEVKNSIVEKSKREVVAMVRTNQGGSILSFVIIGVVLAGLLLGGAYIVNRQTQVPRDTSSSPTISTGPSSPSANKKVSSDDGAEKTPPKTTAPKQVTTPAPDATHPSSSSSAAELPHTGPAEIITSALGLGSLSYALVAYIRSRRSHAITLTSLL
jgi:cytoskeletal protein RodZ